MRLRRIAAASLALSVTMPVALGAPALAADAGPAVSVSAPAPPTAAPATFLGDLACQVLGDFFEKC
ncbi:hypothetical protein M3148_11575 [Georgenia satyanarayanai]|uniref:hypothetical protein n=1 Tax=Georgenia satyanarayanai TaxID=860221 RepID=UPI00203C4F85|nr:hypothetical protein [Georgenia satyanarayanai]MCM3661624.1 hypothetical protein [Georgenia satyanarayanai]